MNTYEYVAVIGIDGMGKFNSQTETPNLDKIFENGAVAWSALSQNPTISAQNWGAMLLGATPIVHKLTNSIISHTHYENTALPSVFKTIREAFPDCYLASVCNWNPINYGIVEENIGVEKLTASTDRELTPLIVDCVKKKPKFLFVQFDDVDGAGHSGGYGTQKHFDEIQRADGYTGEVYNAYVEAGIADKTLFIVIADHGGIRTGHGGYTDTEKYVFLGVSGVGVKKGFIEYAETKDIAAIVLTALGLPVPEYDENGFTSQVPDGIWDGTKPYYKRPAESIEINTRPTPSNIFSFIDKDSTKLLMHLDNSLEDTSGKCTMTQSGCVKFYSNGVNGGCGEFGKTGFVQTNDVSLGNGSFTIAFWVETDPSIPEAPAVVSNQDWWWQHRKNLGVTVALRNYDMLFSLSKGDGIFDTVVPFPDGTTGWMHYIAAFDTDKKEIRFYNNFKHRLTVDIPEEYLISYDTDYPVTVGNDGKGIYNNISHDFIFRLDDVLISGEAFDENKVEKLRQYYYGE